MFLKKRVEVLEAKMRWAEEFEKRNEEKMFNIINDLNRIEALLSENNKQKGSENRLNQPKIVIKSNGMFSEIFVDGKKLNGVRGFSFSHEAAEAPQLHISLLATDVSLEVPTGVSGC